MRKVVNWSINLSNKKKHPDEAMTGRHKYRSLHKENRKCEKEQFSTEVRESKKT